MAEHQQGTGATAQDPLQPLAQRGPGGHRRQGRAEANVVYEFVNRCHVP
jgi:hypothetical protein